MPNEHVHALAAEQKNFIHSEIFGGQTFQDTTKDLETLFFEFLSSECADDNEKRNRIIISYNSLKRLLSMLDSNTTQESD